MGASAKLVLKTSKTDDETFPRMPTGTRSSRTGHDPLILV